MCTGMLTVAARQNPQCTNIFLDCVVLKYNFKPLKTCKKICVLSFINISVRVGTFSPSVLPQPLLLYLVAYHFQ